jgi:hypothetical protein
VQQMGGRAFERILALCSHVDVPRMRLRHDPRMY